MMGNEIESYLCMLSYTDYMINLLFHNKKDIKDIVKTIANKQNELNFSNQEFMKLLSDLKINPNEL